MDFKTLKQGDQNAADEIHGENWNMSLNPMFMEDTLTPILQFLQFDGSFLKSIRFLSKLWNHVALKQFLKSNFFRIPPKSNSEFPTQDEKDAALSQIQEFLKKVGAVQNISINNDFSNDMKIFQTLKNPFRWEKITQIRFNFNFKDNALNNEKIESRTKFIEEMMTKCHHLKFLDISPQSDRTFSQEIGLQIMKSCVKLNRNENLTISNLAAVVSTERDAKIVVGFAETGVRVLNFLAKPMYQLKNDCPLQIPAVSKAFEKIIGSNKNHLISLGLNDRREVFLSDFEIPEKMPELEILHLAAERRSKLKFKDGFQFHKNFPNLNEVNFKLGDLCWFRINPFWTNLFQNQQPCRTVKKLKVMSLDIIDEEIFQVFPDIEELSFSGLAVVRSPKIFKFLERNCKKLRILQLEVPYTKCQWQETRIRFVSSISGFSMDVVRNFVGTDFPRKEALQILKSLEQLHLVCDDESELFGFCKKHMEFLQEHVFSSMPKLKVKCRTK